MSFWKSNKKKNNESDEEVLKAIGAQVPSPLGGDLVTHSPTQSSLGSLGRAGGSPKAIVAEKVTQVGSFFFDASVRIDGKLKGDLFSSGTLYIGAYAVVDAAVSVGTLVVEGVFRGSVEAADVVEIKPGGILEASVKTPAMVIQEGGVFLGEGRVGGF